MPLYSTKEPGHYWRERSPPVKGMESKTGQGKTLPGWEMEYREESLSTAWVGEYFRQAGQYSRLAGESRRVGEVRFWESGLDLHQNRRFPAIRPTSTSAGRPIPASGVCGIFFDFSCRFPVVDRHRFSTCFTPVINKTNNIPEIGISMDMIGTVKLPLFSALKEGMSLTWFITKGTVLGLYTLIAEGIQGKGSFSSVTGPVGMVGIVGDAYQFGFVYLLSFTALISVNLAIINLLPFPALDGGRLFFLLIEKIKGSRINPKFANTANMIGFGILIILMLAVTYHDIVKLF